MKPHRTVVRLLGVFLALTVGATACSTYNKEPDFRRDLASDQDEYGMDAWPPKESIYTQRFVWKMRYLARQLADGNDSVGVSLSPRQFGGHANRQGNGKTVLMTTLAPVEDLYRATPFGRICAEQLMTEMSALGYRVIEPRKTTGYYIKDHEGEFSLSRKGSEVAAVHQVDAVLVGTFARSGPQALINVRLVAASDAAILSAATAQMDLRGDRFLESMMDAAAYDEMTTPRRERSQDDTGILNYRPKLQPETDPYSVTLDLMIRQMAQNAFETAPKLMSGKKPRIMVATFVDIDHLYRATTFGRFLADRLIGELATFGADVAEVRITPEMYTDIRIGELAMTREMSQLIGDHSADAYLVGTYTRAGDQALVNARLVMGQSKKVVGVGQMVVDAGPKNKFVQAMLENEVTTVMPGETVEGY